MFSSEGQFRGGYVDLFVNVLWQIVYITLISCRVDQQVRSPWTGLTALIVAGEEDKNEPGIKGILTHPLSSEFASSGIT